MLNEVLSGIALILLIILIVFVFYNKKDKKDIQKQQHTQNRKKSNLGYFIGFANTPSPRIVAPHRPNVYNTEIPIVVVEHPDRRKYKPQIMRPLFF